MKQILIIILIATSFVSCTSDKNPDITFDQNSGDTLQVIKRYSSKKIKEIFQYKDNNPSSSLGFSETGDTLKIPTITYVKADNILFIYIPIQKKYSRMALLFEKSDTNHNTFDSALVIEPKIISSIDVPVNNKMIHNKKIRGFIKTMNTDHTIIDNYPFQLIVDEK